MVPLHPRLLGKWFNIGRGTPFYSVGYIESISQSWNPVVYLCLILSLIIFYRTTSKIYPAGLIVSVSTILATKPSLFQTGRGSRPFSEEKECDSLAQNLNGGPGRL